MDSPGLLKGLSRSDVGDERQSELNIRPRSEMDKLSRSSRNWRVSPVVTDLSDLQAILGAQDKIHGRCSEELACSCVRDNEKGDLRVVS